MNTLLGYLMIVFSFLLFLPSFAFFIKNTEQRFIMRLIFCIEYLVSAHVDNFHYPDQDLIQYIQIVIAILK